MSDSVNHNVTVSCGSHYTLKCHRKNVTNVNNNEIKCCFNTTSLVSTSFGRQNASIHNKKKKNLCKVHEYTTF